MVSTVTYLQIVDEVNRTRSSERKFSAFGWTAQLKRYELLREYQRLFPSGSLTSRWRLSTACGLAALAISSGTLLGLFPGLFLASGAMVFACWILYSTRPRSSDPGYQRETSRENITNPPVV